MMLGASPSRAGRRPAHAAVAAKRRLAAARPCSGVLSVGAVRTVAIAAVLLLYTGCAAASRVQYLATDPVEREAWKYGDQPGTRLVTRHYEIFTTLKDDYLIGFLPGLMESAFEEYRSLVPATREPAERMKVYLFANRGQWSQFTRRFTGELARVFLQIRNGGYSERGVTVIEYVAHQTTFPIMTHEGFHQYLYHYVDPNVPAWLNEGLASYFEGQRWGAEGVRSFDPWHNPYRRNVLAEALLANRLLPLGELLETHAGRVIFRSSRTVATYYAQVWALVLFLKEGAGGKYAASLTEMLNQLGSGALRAGPSRAPDGREYSPGEALFRAFISEDLETVEREYQSFLRQRMLNER